MGGPTFHGLKLLFLGDDTICVIGSDGHIMASCFKSIAGSGFSLFLNIIHSFPAYFVSTQVQGSQKR